MSSKIELTKGKFAIVDDEDFEFLSGFSWYADPCKGGNHKVCGYAHGKTVSMHRLLLDFPPRDIDHINGNALDNRRCNLRLCTNAQNQANSMVRPSKSGYKGVYHRPRRNFCWEAQIQFQYHRYFIGLFETAEEAATSYALHALSAYGEFARFEPEGVK